MLFQNLNEQAKENAREIFTEMAMDAGDTSWQDGVYQTVDAIANMLGIQIEADRNDFHDGVYVFEGTFQPDPNHAWKIDRYIRQSKLAKDDPRYVFLLAYKTFLKQMFPHQDEWYRWLDTFCINSDMDALDCDESVKAILEDFCYMVVSLFRREEEWQYSDAAIERMGLDWTENGELVEDDEYLPDPPAEIIIPA